MLVETDAGTTASTVLSKNAKARTAKEDCHRPKPAEAIYPSTQIASRPPLRNLWVSIFIFIYVFYFINPFFAAFAKGWAYLHIFL